MSFTEIRPRDLEQNWKMLVSIILTRRDCHRVEKGKKHKDSLSLSLCGFLQPNWFFWNLTLNVFHSDLHTLPRITLWVRLLGGTGNSSTWSVWSPAGRQRWNMSGHSGCPTIGFYTPTRHWLGLTRKPLKRAGSPDIVLRQVSQGTPLSHTANTTTSLRLKPFHWHWHGDQWSVVHTTSI